MSGVKNTRTMPHRSQTRQMVRPDGTYTEKQGLTYFAGISAQTVVSQGLCMHLLHLPPGARATPHMHEGHETAVYVLRGEVQMWYGDKLEHHSVVRAGEFQYISSGVPHQPFNASETEAVAVLARTNPNEQESVVLLPELDTLHP